MNLLAAPAVALLKLLSTPQRFVLMAASYGLPIAAALYLLAAQPGASARAAWIAGLALALLGGLYLVLAWHLQTRAGFRGVRAAIEHVAAGDLRYRSEKGNQGAVWGLAYKIDEASERLAGVFAQIRASAQAIEAASREISGGHVNLSQRTEEQASTLEETASGMEEVAATVKQNAENCERASGLSRDASAVAQEGAQTVHRAVERMGMIDRSSRKIVDIIGVIEGIAFQTNILALNAAVEAARAGEQGRGFAVVASEVRELAQRSAQAAKEIKALIEASVADVSEGGKLVREAGETIEKIVQGVRQVSELIGEVALASREQSSGVEEINRAIVQLQGVTQQNAALVEQATAATLAFEEHTRHLVAATGAFDAASSGRQSAR